MKRVGLSKKVVRHLLTLIDVTEIVSVAAMEWQVRDDVHDEVLEFYTTRAVPLIVTSPAVLRFRLFKVDNATTLQGDSYTTEDKEKLHTYFSMVELDSEHWPWDVVIELADVPEWKEYFEKQVVVVCIDTLTSHVREKLTCDRNGKSAIIW